MVREGVRRKARQERALSQAGKGEAAVKAGRRMRNAVLCAVLCLIGAFCIGAGVQEGSKAALEAGAQLGASAGVVELWRVTENEVIKTYLAITGG